MKFNHQSKSPMHHSLKIKYTILSGLLFLLTACGGEKEKAETIPDAPMHTLVFLDKTQSVNVNRAYVNEK